MDIKFPSDSIGGKPAITQVSDLLAQLKAAGTIEAEVVKLLQGKLLLSSRLGDILTSNTLSYKTGDRLTLRLDDSAQQPVLKAGPAKTGPITIDSRANQELTRALPADRPSLASLIRVTAGKTEIRLAGQEVRLSVELPLARGQLLRLRRNDTLRNIEILPLDRKAIYKAVLKQLIPRQAETGFSSLVKLISLVKTTLDTSQAAPVRRMGEPQQSTAPSANSTVNRQQSTASTQQRVVEQPQSTPPPRQQDTARQQSEKSPALPTVSRRQTSMPPTRPMPPTQPGPPLADRPTNTKNTSATVSRHAEVKSVIDNTNTSLPAKTRRIVGSTADARLLATAGSRVTTQNSAASNTDTGAATQAARQGYPAPGITDSVLKPAATRPPGSARNSEAPVQVGAAKTHPPVNGTTAARNSADAVMPATKPAPVAKAGGDGDPAPPGSRTAFLSNQPNVNHGNAVAASGVKPRATATPATPSLLWPLVQMVTRHPQIDAAQIKQWFEFASLIRPEKPGMPATAASNIPGILKQYTNPEIFGRALLEALQQGSRAALDSDSTANRPAAQESLLPLVREGVKLAELSLSQNLLQRATLGLQQETQQPLAFSLALPLLDEQEVKTLYIDLAQRNQAPRETDRSWDIRLSFEIAGLGPITTHIILEGTNLAASFYSKLEQTRERIEAELPQLKRQLISAGFTPGEFYSFPGTGAQERPPGTTDFTESLVDIEV